MLCLGLGRVSPDLVLEGIFLSFNVIAHPEYMQILQEEVGMADDIACVCFCIFQPELDFLGIHVFDMPLDFIKDDLPFIVIFDHAL